MRLFELGLLLALLSCGGSDAQCVVDTDCDLFQRCSAAHCVPVGDYDGGTSGRDAALDGHRADDSGPSDGGTARVGTGTVLASSTPLDIAGTDASTWIFSASFVRDDAASTGVTCSISPADGCSVTDCTVAPPPADGGMPADAGVDAGTPTFDHAGEISTSGATMPLLLMPGADGLYTPASGTGLLFTDGMTLTYAAVGDAIPAFGGSIASPSSVTITAPSFAAGTITADRSIDLPLAWTSAAAAPGTLVASLSATEFPPDGGSRTITIVCELDGSGASGVVPAAALALLPDAASGSISFLTRSSLRTSAGAGAWEVTLEATVTATSDANAPAIGALSVP